MPRLIIVAQDKGGSGKSLVTRALAEAVPEAPVIELEGNHRLVELGSRVKHCPMRASFEEIQRTGSKASRAEFDLAIDSMVATPVPAIVDVGANVAKFFLPVLADLAPDLKEAGLTIGVLFVVTSELHSQTSVRSLQPYAEAFADAQFFVENRRSGAVAPDELKRIAGKSKVSVLEEVELEEKAIPIYEAGGLACIPRLDKAALKKQHGFSLGNRVHGHLTALRLQAMQAVEPAAMWLVS